MVAHLLRHTRSEAIAQGGQAHGRIWRADAVVGFSLLDDARRAAMSSLGVNRVAGPRGRRAGDSAVPALCGGHPNDPHRDEASRLAGGAEGPSNCVTIRFKYVRVFARQKAIL